MANADSKIFGASVGSAVPGTVACQVLSCAGGAVVSGGIATTSILASGAIQAASINAAVSPARSGQATIPLGAATIAVPLAGIAAGSIVLACEAGAAPDATLGQLAVSVNAGVGFSITGVANATAATTVNWYWVR